MMLVKVANQRTFHVAALSACKQSQQLLGSILGVETAKQNHLVVVATRTLVQSAAKSQKVRFAVLSSELTGPPVRVFSSHH